MNRTALFVANRGYALGSSRTQLIRCFIEGGWRVVLVTADDADSRALCRMGAELEEVVFDRGGTSPMADARAISRLMAIVRARRPSLVQQFHAKPVIFGTLAARAMLGRSVRIVNAITGLGQAFVQGGMAARVAGFAYAVAMPRADTLIFQNTDDRRFFLDRGWVNAERARLVAGSGVDLDRFVPADRSARDASAPVVVMLARLLRQKGIREFATVATRVRERWPNARFLLAGEEESTHPDGLDVECVQAYEDIEYLGRLADVRPLLAEADLFLFPSRYREGLPRVILEAGATGLPVVAFDVPGVREAVRDGETGRLIPEQDVDALTGSVQTLLEDDSRRREMGYAARRMVEESFDLRAIEARYLSIYRELGVRI